MDTSIKLSSRLIMDSDYTKHKHQTTGIIHSPKANFVMNVCNCT